MFMNCTAHASAALRKQFAEVQLVRGERPEHALFALFNDGRAVMSYTRDIDETCFAHAVTAGPRTAKWSSTCRTASTMSIRGAHDSVHRRGENVRVLLSANGVASLD